MFVLTAHCDVSDTITYSAEYLTNLHILSKYFESEVLQLHLVKISCKLNII